MFEYQALYIVEFKVSFPQVQGQQIIRKFLRSLLGEGARPGTICDASAVTIDS
jgi:hypothetical protein